MGLLTNEESRNRVVIILVKHNEKLCVLSYVIGLVWFCALAYQPLNAGTYFSENALLPGLVESEITSPLSSLEQYTKDVETKLKNDTKELPQGWLFEKFQELGLEVFRQNFSVIYPFTFVSSKVVTGENVYAILRARRAASTEALVLSVPLRSLSSKVKPPSGGGVALALALAKEFKQKPYWSKDIIFLFTDFNEVGTMAWLDAYHQSKSKYIVTQELDGRSGPIQAAINLELPLESVNYYNLRLEGLNGQLPNLDLVNLLVRMCQREGAQVTIHHSGLKKKQLVVRPDGDSFEDYTLALSTMFRMMWYQASGAPSGNHGLFHKFHIEAVSIQGIVKRKGSQQHDFTTTARILEGIFRSLNNLLEKFHQSFFFYLLPSTKRYISIGMYMPPFGLMALTGLIKGIALWVGADEVTNKDTEESGNESKKKKVGKKSETGKELNTTGSETQSSVDKEEAEKDKVVCSPDDSSKKDSDETETSTAQGTQEEAEEEDEEEEQPANKGATTVIPVILVTLLLGWMAHQGPELLTRIMPRFRIHTEDMVLYSMLAIFTAALMYPRLMTKKSNNPTVFVLDWRFLKSVALIGQTLALASISLQNISQAFFLTAIMVPVTTFVRPVERRILRWIQMLALVLVSPLSIVYLAGIISSWPQSSALSLIVESYTTSKEMIFLGVMDSYLFNAWTETVVTVVLFPIWLLFWAIPWVDPL